MAKLKHRVLASILSVVLSLSSISTPMIANAEEISVPANTTDTNTDNIITTENPNKMVGSSDIEGLSQEDLNTLLSGGEVDGWNVKTESQLVSDNVSDTNTEVQVLSEDKSNEIQDDSNSSKKESTFKTFIDGDTEGLSFSSKELLIGTEDPTIFTCDTEVISEYEGVYLTRYASEEETRNAYLYYLKLADFVAPNIEFSVSDESTDSEANLSNLNQSDDAISTLNELVETLEESKIETNEKIIALIDTGVNSTDVMDSVSLIDNSLKDKHGHGTKMFNIIRNEYSNAKVLSIKAMDENGKGQVSDIYAAIKYAILYKVDIINLSLSAYSTVENAAIKNIIQEAINTGITVVGAAGNDSKDVKYYIPGNIENAIIAGACDSDGNRIASSNYGDTVDYYVVAKSTSEATAKISAYLANNKDLTTLSNIFTINNEVIEDQDDDVRLGFDKFTVASTETITYDGVEYQVPDRIYLSYSINNGIHDQGYSGYFGAQNRQGNGTYILGDYTFPTTVGQTGGSAFCGNYMSYNYSGPLTSYNGVSTDWANFSSKYTNSAGNMICAKADDPFPVHATGTACLYRISNTNAITVVGDKIRIPYLTWGIPTGMGNNYQSIAIVHFIEVPKESPKSYYVAIKKVENSSNSAMNNVSFDVEVTYKDGRVISATKGGYTGYIYDVNSKNYTTTTDGYGVLYLGECTESNKPTKVVVTENWTGEDSGTLITTSGQKSIKAKEYQASSNSSTITETGFSNSVNDAITKATGTLVWKNTSIPPGPLYVSFIKTDTLGRNIDGVTFNVTTNTGKSIRVQTGNSYDITTGKSTGTLSNHGVCVIYLGSFYEGDTKPTSVTVNEDWSGSGTAYKGSTSDSVTSSDYVTSGLSKTITSFSSTLEGAISAASSNKFENEYDTPGAFYIAFKKQDEKGYQMKNVSFTVTVTGQWEGDTTTKTKTYTVRTGNSYNFTKSSSSDDYSDPQSSKYNYGAVTAYLGEFKGTPKVTADENWTYAGSYSAEQQKPYPMILYDSNGNEVESYNYPTAYPDDSGTLKITAYADPGGWSEAISHIDSFTYTNYRTEHETPKEKDYYFIIRKYIVNDITGEQYPINNVPFSIYVTPSGREEAAIYVAYEQGTDLPEHSDIVLTGKYINDNNLSGVITGYYSNVQSRQYISIKPYDDITKMQREFPADLGNYNAYIQRLLQQAGVTSIDELNLTNAFHNRIYNQIQSILNRSKQEGYVHTDEFTNIEPGNGFAVVYLGKYYYKPDVYIAENWIASDNKAELVKGKEEVDGQIHYIVDPIFPGDIESNGINANTAKLIRQISTQDENMYKYGTWPMGDIDDPNNPYYDVTNDDNETIHGALLIQSGDKYFIGSRYDDQDDRNLKNVLLTETSATDEYIHYVDSNGRSGYYFKTLNNHTANILYISLEKSSLAQYVPSMDGVQYGLYFKQADEDHLIATYTLDEYGKVKSITPNNNIKDSLAEAQSTYINWLNNNIKNDDSDTHKQYIPTNDSRISIYNENNNRYTTILNNAMNKYGPQGLYDYLDEYASRRHDGIYITNNLSYNYIQNNYQKPTLIGTYNYKASESIYVKLNAPIGEKTSGHRAYTMFVKDNELNKYTTTINDNYKLYYDTVSLYGIEESDGRLWVKIKTSDLNKNIIDYDNLYATGMIDHRNEYYYDYTDMQICKNSLCQSNHRGTNYLGNPIPSGIATASLIQSGALPEECPQDEDVYWTCPECRQKNNTATKQRLSKDVYVANRTADSIKTYEETLEEGTFIIKEIATNGNYVINDEEFSVPEMKFMENTIKESYYVRQSGKQIQSGYATSQLDASGNQTPQFIADKDTAPNTMQDETHMYFAAVKKVDNNNNPINGVTFDITVNGETKTKKLKSGNIYNFDANSYNFIGTYDQITKGKITTKVPFTCTTTDSTGTHTILDQNGDPYTIDITRQDGVALVYLGVFPNEPPTVSVKENWTESGELVTGVKNNIVQVISVQANAFTKDAEKYDLTVAETPIEVINNDTPIVTNEFHGSIQVKKKLAPESVANQSPAGAEYTVTADPGQSFTYSGKCIIKADGTSNVLSGLQIGKYTIKETKEPTSGDWELDTKEYHVTITPEGGNVTVTEEVNIKATNATIESTDIHVKYDFYISFNKTSTDSNYKPSMQGIQYGLYYENTDDSNLVATFTMDEDGYIESVKKNTSWSNSIYKYIGAIIHTNKHLYIQLQTDGSVDTISSGTFKIKEISLNGNTNYESNSTISNVPALNKDEFALYNGLTLTALAEKPVYGSIQVHKTLENATANDSPAGAEYTVTAVAGQDFIYTGKCTIKADGTSNILTELRPGKYNIKETKAPTNGSWKLDNNTYQVTITTTDGNKSTDQPVELKATNATIESIDYHDTKPVYLIKTSGANTDSSSYKETHNYNTSTSNNGLNPNYSLEGTTYDVYNKLTNVKVGTLICDANGKTNTIDLTADFNLDNEDHEPKEYYAIEIKAGKNYKKNPNQINFTITNANNNENPYIIETSDDITLDTISITVEKKDLASGKYIKPVSDAANAQAKYTIKYYPEDVSKHYSVNYLKSLEDSGDIVPETYDITLKYNESTKKYEATTSSTIPNHGMGYLIIEEIQAPTGFEIEGSQYVMTLVDSNTITLDKDEIPLIILDRDDPTDNNATIHAYLWKDNQRHQLNQIAESITITSNDSFNPTWSSELTSTITNSHTGYVNGSTINTDSVKDVFSITNVPNDVELTYKAQLIDTTTKKSIHTSNSDNTNYVSQTYTSLGVQKQDIEFDFGTFTPIAGHNYTSVINVYGADGELFDSHNSTLDIENQTIHYPTISTDLVSSTTENHIGVLTQNDSLVDNITLTNFAENDTIVINGKLIDTTTNSQITTASQTVTPAQRANFKSITFRFDSRGLAGKKVASVVTASINGKVVYEHNANYTIEAEAVYYPLIETDLSSGINVNTQFGSATAEDSAIDKISFTNVPKDTNIRFVGELYDITNKANPSKIGNSVETTVPSQSLDKQFVNIVFTYNSSDYIGKILAAKVTTYINDKVVSVHNDTFTDTREELYYVELSTRVKNSYTNSQLGTLSTNENVVDTVILKNVPANVKLSFTGELWDINNNKLISTTSNITNYTSTGLQQQTIELAPFIYDSSKFTTTKLGVKLFAKINDGATIVYNNDLSDINEMIYYMDMSTELLSNNNKFGKISNPEGPNAETATETIKFTNIPNRVKVHLVCQLLDKTNNNAEISKVETDITSTGLQEQTKTITYNYDSTNLAGHTLSAKVVASYEDSVVFNHNIILSDLKETIYYLNGQTTASDKNTNTQLALDSETTIVDLFSLQNLIKGQKYTITGTVHKRNKNTGLDDGVLKDSNGKDISKTITLIVGANGSLFAEDENHNQLTTTVKSTTEETVSGTVEIEFSVDGSLLRDVTTTIFEKVSIDEIPIFVHADINDKEQQVHFMDLSTNLKDSSTKDSVAIRKVDDKIVDTITFTDVPINTTIKFDGILMDKSTKESLKIGTNEVKSSATLVVDGNGQTTSSGATITKFDTETNTVSGTINLVFTFNSTNLANITAVSFITATLNDKVVWLHNTYNDLNETIYYANVHTNASDINTNVNVAKYGNTTIKDIVSCENLVFGKEYSIVGTVHKKAVDGTDAGVLYQNNEAIKKVATVKVDAEGNATLTNATNAKFEKNTTDKTITGTIEMTFDVDSSLLSGEDIVLFEDLEHENIKIAVHNNIKDKTQTIHIPNGNTTAIDSVTNTKLMSNSNNATIKDTFHIENVSIGHDYTVKAEAHVRDKETKKDLGILKDSSNKNVTTNVNISITDTGVITATANGKNLEVKNVVVNEDVVSADIIIDLVVDSLKLENITTTVFEYMYCNDEIVLKHENINDQGQQTNFMQLRTNINDEDTKDSVAVKKSNDVIRDVLTFENVSFGSKVIFTGTLMNKDTQSVMKSNDADIVSTVTLTVGNDGTISSSSEKATDVDIIGVDLDTKTVTGTINLYYTYDSSKFEDVTLVSFVTAQDVNSNEEVAIHNNYNDNLETIYYTSIHTNFNDRNTKTNVAKLGTTTLVDTISINNLVYGKKYVVEGVLHTKDKDGKEIGILEDTLKKATIAISDTGEVTLENAENAQFTKNEAKGTITGTIDMIFEVDSSKLVGQDIVAFEKLYHNEILIDAHEDISDDNQTIHVPTGGTTAIDSETKDHVATVKENETITIPDTIKLENLAPNQKYHLYGILMDKDTKESLKINGKEIIVECDFATTANSITSENEVLNVTYNDKNNDISGEIVMNFVLSSKDLANKDIVVFETGYIYDVDNNKHVIFEEKDIDNLDQTVHFPEVSTIATDDTYNDHTGLVSETESITEKSILTNLVFGMTYEVKATVIDQKTKNAVLDTNGNEVTKTTIVTINKDASIIKAVEKDTENEFVVTINKVNKEDQTVDITVDIPIIFNSKEQHGKDIVIFEDLYHNDILVRSHHDIDDKDEQIHYYELNLYKKGIVDFKQVQFTLIQNDVKIKFTKISDGHYLIDSNGTEDVLVPDNEGLVNINGFNTDPYIITEIKTETGKNLLKNPISIQFVPSSDDTDKTTLNVINDNINMVISSDNDELPNTISIVIENNQVVSLMTGGIGTTIFYILAIILVLMSLGLCIYKKKYSE